jgi:hypothetical protein
MAQAWSDPVFQVDFHEQGSVYACRYCHTPLVEQRPELVLGLASLRPVRGDGEPNPAYDAALRDEGVNCAACHVREGTVVGSFEGHQAPHAVTVDASLGSVETCAACHQAPAPPFTPLSRPLLDVVAEWETWKATTGRDDDCVDCHMPQVERPLTAWTPPRLAHAHDFPGAWDDDFVRAAIRLDGIERTGSGVRVYLENLAGHRFPSSDPARSLVVRARLSTADGHPAEATARVERRVEFPSYTERWDHTLAPGERRALDLSFPAADLALATGVTVDLEWSRLANGSAAVRALEPAPTRLHTASITF